MMVPRKRRAGHFLYAVVAVLFFGIVLTCINIYELKQIHHGQVGIGPPHVEAINEAEAINVQGSTDAKYWWLYGKKVGSFLFIEYLL